MHSICSGKVVSVARLDDADYCSGLTLGLAKGNYVLIVHRLLRMCTLCRRKNDPEIGGGNEGAQIFQPSLQRKDRTTRRIKQTLDVMLRALDVLSGGISLHKYL